MTSHCCLLYTSAEVFDYDAVNRAFTDCVFELLEVWTIEGNAAITIVNERLTDNFQIVMPRNVVLANGSLACNGVAFNFVPVFTGDVYKRQASVRATKNHYEKHRHEYELQYFLQVVRNLLVSSRN